MGLFTWSLTAVAQRAQNIEAGAHIFGTLSSGSSLGINAMQNQKRTCLACKKPGHILKDCRMWKAFKAKAGSQNKGKGKLNRGKGKARGGKGSQGNVRAIAGLQESQEEDWLNGDVNPSTETELEDCDEEEEDDQESGNA